jgi:hypothetical protein
MNELDRDVAYEFAFEGLDHAGFRVTAAFKDIPWRIKLDAIKILNLTTLRWYKNRLIDIDNPNIVQPSDQEIIMYHAYEMLTVDDLIKLEQQWRDDEKDRM